MHVSVRSDVIRPLCEFNGFLLVHTGGDGRQEGREGRRRERATRERSDSSLNSGMNLRGGEGRLEKPRQFSPQGFRCSVSPSQRPRPVGSFFDSSSLVFNH